MKPIIREAVYISQDFGDATFVGAIAVMLHADKQRQSQDLDFVVAEQIGIDEFLDKGYKINWQKNKKFTPRGYKIDVYSNAHKFLYSQFLGILVPWPSHLCVNHRLLHSERHLYTFNVFFSHKFVN